MRNNTPNWYHALREHAWTAHNIQREFAITRTLARDWQQSPPASYSAARLREQAHQELISQVGH